MYIHIHVYAHTCIYIQQCIGRRKCNDTSHVQLHQYISHTLIQIHIFHSVWDVESETTLYTLNLDSAPVLVQWCSGDAEKIAVASENGTVHFLCVAKARIYANLHTHTHIYTHKQ